MYHLLIVEDENIIRNGLVHIINKMNLSLASIHEARNGADALDILLEIDIDLIITDINMPTLDGLSFIKQAKVSNPDLLFIILSGYSDFKFAQQAIAFGVNDYLLKPIDKTQLKNSLKKLISKLNDKNHFQQKYREEADRMVHLKNQVLWHQLTDTLYKKQFETTISYLKQKLKNKNFLVLSIRFNIDIDDPFQQFYDSALGNLLTENGQIFLTHMTEYKYLFVLCNLTEECNLVVKSYLSKGIENRLHYQVGISNFSTDINHLPILIKEARFALDQRLLCNETFFFWYTEPKFQLNTMNTLKNKMIHTSASEYASYLNAYFIELKNKKVPIRFILDQTKKLGQLYDTNLTVKNMLQTTKGAHFSLSNASTFNHFLDEIIKNFMMINKTFERAIKEKSPIEKALVYIDSYYHTDISLESISQFVSMNPSYFSSQFKKNTNLTFSQYLQQFRINQSIILLEDPEITIDNVAHLVGFNDEKYFFKVFKKITGKTPRQK